MSKLSDAGYIWVYQIDTADSKKSKIANSFLEELSTTHRAVVSTQVINEFYVTLIKKLKLDPRDAKEAARALYEAEIVSIDLDLIDRAIEIGILNRLSHWDALIVAAAESHGCDSLISEDLNSGQRFGDLEIVNPFRGPTTKPRKSSGKKMLR